MSKLHTLLGYSILRDAITDVVDDDEDKDDDDDDESGPKCPGSKND